MTTPLDTIELPVEPRAVEAAIRWLESLGEREGWSPRLLYRLTLSLDEALTNVVNYAFAERAEAAPAARIVLEYRHAHGEVELCLRDNGAPFDPTAAAAPPTPGALEDAAIGGHGLRLMHHYLDRLSYERRGDENRLTLAAAEAPAA